MKHGILTALAVLAFSCCQAQDTISIKTTRLSDMSIFNFFSSSRPRAYQFKFGEGDWQPAGPLAKKLKPYLITQPDALKDWKKFKAKAITSGIGKTAYGVGAILLAFRAFERIGDDTGDDATLFTGVGLFIGGGLISFLFKKSARKSFYKSVQKYNAHVR